MRKDPGKIISILIVASVAFTMLITSSLAGENKTELPGKKDGELYQYISKTNPYTGWQLWPGTHKLYPGKRPHGAFLTNYVNDIALKSLKVGDKKFPPGSIIVKENYNKAKKLVVITAMYKVDGYNPMGGDWYWLKYTPEGKIEAEGTVTSCIGCHSSMISEDWVFTKKP
ncbi:MAG: cytochrome P460 family protein [Deltaproteobacteria bacterium]